MQNNIYLVFCCLFVTILFSSNSFSANLKEPELASKNLLTQEQIVASKYAISTSHPLATEAGLKILQKGGNAVDAAIAASLVLGVVEPQASGIGGGGFATLYNSSTKTFVTFDGRELAPELANENMFLKDGKEREFYDVVHGGLSVGVPGYVSLINLMHSKYGRFSWSALFTDAINIANNGFSVSQRLAVHTEEIEKKYLSRIDFKDWHIYFNGLKAKKENDIIVNKELAKTLSYIKNSPHYFYSKFYADRISQRLTRLDVNKGIMLASDITKYKALIKDPVCIIYREVYKICGPDGPSSAVTIMQALKILENFNLSQVYKKDPNLVIYLANEALRLALADRAAVIGDRAFNEYNPMDLVDSFYTKTRSQFIDLQNTIKNIPIGLKPLSKDTSKSETTTHISVIDSHGNAVSMTNSIENFFGSFTMLDGFIFNNTMTDFGFNPQNADSSPNVNKIQAFKRPRSAMSPIIVTNIQDGSVALVVGSPGGVRILSFVLKSIILALDIKLEPRVVLSAPNFASIAADGGKIELEKRAKYALINTKKILKDRGVIVDFENDLVSGVNLIASYKDPKDGSLKYKAAADFRRQGLASGF